jgi:hypothetical protein
MDTRPTTRLGEIVFERFPHPPLDTSSESRTATHEPIGAPTVTDHLGSKAREFTMVGHCGPSTGSDIDDLAEESEHNLRHARHSGPVIVLSADTESDGAFIDAEDGILRYTYTIKMKEVQ